MTPKAPLMINSYDPTKNLDLDDDLITLIKRRTKTLGPSHRLFYDKPVHFVRAKGVRMYDEKGQDYLDVYNNVPSVGHCHPRVVEALAQQAAKLNTHTRYLSDVVLEYAERLLETFPEVLSRVMFTCTGSKANDAAFRVARHKTGNAGLIVTANAYHGITETVSAASPSLGNGVPVGNHIRLVTLPDIYRTGEQDPEGRFERDVQFAIDDLARHGFGTSAIVMDTIFSSDGVMSHPIGFICGAVAAVRRAGGLYIADEVQTGFGRTGEKMWGFQRHGVLPDVVTLGKPMANGLPLAAVIANVETFSKFADNARYFNTFAGNPVCCAAGLAVLDVLRDEGLQINALTVGEYMRHRLKKFAARDERIGDIRGSGLFIGVDMVTDGVSKEPDQQIALALVNRLRELHVLISSSGKWGNVLKIRPPLPFSMSDTDEFLEKFELAIYGMV